jgi:large subunit ribosomal protein L18
MKRKIVGTTDRPRLSVFRSNKMLYTQIINDEKGITLVSEKGKDGKEIGLKLAEAAKKKKVKKIVFDKNGYAYHGKIKAIAEGAREGGLDF